MMRIKFVTLAVTFLLLIPTNEPSFAQTKARKKPSEEGWVTLKNGGKVLRLFETEAGPKMPEIAILQLPKPRYEEFEKDPTSFVKDNKIFPGREIIKVVHAKESGDKTKEAGGGAANDVVLVIVHTICEGVYSYLVGASP